MSFNLDTSSECLEQSPTKLTQEQVTRSETNRKRALERKKFKENEAKM